jgi:hypothetical protein
MDGTTQYTLYFKKILRKLYTLYLDRRESTTKQVFFTRHKTFFFINYKKKGLTDLLAKKRYKHPH